MANPQIYAGVGIACLLYLIFGPSKKAKNEVKYDDLKSPMTPAARQMQVMRFAAESDKPLYRMTPKEIRDLSRGQ